MELSLAQTNLVGLTMKLDLKVREYKMLCDKLEEYKKENIDENDEKLYKLLEKFQKNNEEIVELKKQLKQIENLKEITQEKNVEKFNYENIFKAKEKNKIDESNYNNDNKMVKYQNSLWIRIKNKIKRIFGIQ